MLCLNVGLGEYVTISDNIVVQIFPSGSNAQLLISAPREIPIVRGKVLEREGKDKPKNLYTQRRRPRSASDDAHSQKYFERKAMYVERAESAKAAMEEMAEILDGMAPTAERDALRQRLEWISVMSEPVKPGVSADAVRE